MNQLNKIPYQVRKPYIYPSVLTTIMPIRILVIEDVAQIRENIAELLTAHGYEIKTASTGEEGIDMAIQWQPDLILSDIIMANKDGYQVLETIRRSPALAHTPFIFLTAKADMVDLRWGMSLGADDYLTKPFQINDLLAAIESRLRRSQQLLGPANGTASFLKTIVGRDQQGSMMLQAEACFYFFTEERKNYVRHPLGTFQVTMTLEELAAELDNRQFFRANRHIILNRKVLQKYSYWHNGKYCLFLLIDGQSQEVTLAKARFAAFKEWLSA